MNPQRLGEKGSYSNITRLSFWPRLWVRNRLGASGTDEKGAWHLMLSASSG